MMMNEDVHARQLIVLGAITRATTELDIQSMLEMAVDQLGRLSGADGCYIALWDAEKQQTIPTAAYGHYKGDYRSYQLRRGERTLTETVLDRGESLQLSGPIPGDYVSTRLSGDFPAASVLVIPLMVREEKLGSLILIFSRPYTFPEAEIQLYEQAANQIALALSKARLLDATRRQLEELRVLHALASAGASALGEDLLLDEATTILGAAFAPDNFGVLLLQEEEGILHTHASYRRGRQEQGGINLSLEEGICGSVARSGVPRRVADITLEEDYLPIDPETKSELCVPIKSGERILGVINAESKSPGAFSAADEQLLLTFGRQLATALDRVRLLEAERRRREEAEVVREAIAALTSVLDLRQVLDQILVHLETVIAFEGAAVFLLQHGALRLVAARGAPPGKAEAGQRLAADNQLFQMMASARQAIFLADARQDPRYEGGDRHEQVRGWMGVPLFVGERAIGCLTVHSNRVNAYGPAHAALVQTFAHQAAVAVKNASLFESIHRNAGELEAMSEILRSLNALPDVRQALPGVQTGLARITGCQRAGLALLNQERTLFTLFALEPPGTEAEEPLLLPVDASPATTAVLAGEIYHTADLETERTGPLENALYIAGYRSRLVLPLLVGKIVVGSLNISWRRQQGYQERQLPLLRQIADAVALAVERSRLFQATQANLVETRALYQVSRSLSAIENLSQLLQTVVDNVAAALPADRVVLLTVDTEGERIVDYVTDREGTITLEPLTYEELQQGLSGWVLRHRRPVLSTKDRADRKESERLQRRRIAIGAGSILVVPLQYRGQILGTMTAVNRADQPDFTRRNLELMTAMAHQVAVAITNARLFEEIHAHALELEVLADISAALRVAEGRSEIMEILLDACLELFAAEKGSIAVPDENGKALYVVHQKGWPFSIQAHAFGLENSIFGHVYATGEPYVTSDLATDSLVHQEALEDWISHEQPPSAAMYVPLLSANRVVGIIQIGAAAPRLFDGDDLRLLLALAEIAGSALHRAGLMETLEQRVIERTYELALANERLQELDRMKSKFVSDVSHELRTPITNLLLYLDLYERGRQPRERRERYLSVLRKQAERLNELIEDILNLSRLEFGRNIGDFSYLDLNALVAESIEAFGPEAQAAQLDLSFQPCATLPNLWGQREQISRVLDNLLSNAINYTAEGHVHVTTEQDGDELLLIIEDTGMGIMADDLPHVFERFYRGQRAAQSNIPGTGLGLALVQEIVNLHAGRITIKSREEQGTQVTVSFPIPVPENN